MQTALDQFPDAAEQVVPYGVRTALVTPLVREAVAIGAIQIRRLEVRPFSEKQITLLQIFADQAVIAIENTRLFKELETRNRELTESLDRQTATGDILRAISQAQTDPQPVFEAIAESAMRLFGAWSTTVFRYDGELISLVAARGGAPGSTDAVREQFQPPHPPINAAEVVVLTKEVQHVADVESDQSCTSEFR